MEVGVGGGVQTFGDEKVPQFSPRAALVFQGVSFATLHPVMNARVLSTLEKTVCLRIPASPG